MRLAHYLLLALASLSSLAFASGLIVHAFSSSSHGIALFSVPIFSVILLGIGLVAGATMPHLAVLGFVGVAPLFGNRPGSTQALLFLALNAGLQLGSLIPILRLLPNAEVRSSKLWTLATCYVLVSVGSVVAIPWALWWSEFRTSIEPASVLSSLTHFLLTTASITEERLYYVALSIYWTISAWQLGLYLFLATQTQRVRSSALWWTIQASVLLSLCVGVLDYFEAIDLRSIRALDPVVNPGDVQFRLQSWFGHSGWFAEFVTLAIPSVMIWLCARLRFSVRLSIILAVLLLGEFVLVLTFQRGGWLSYPLTLFFVWASIYVSRRIEHGGDSVQHALRRSFVKILITLPLTLIASISLLWLVNQYSLSERSAVFSVSRYIERAKDITRTSDRSQFIEAALLLTSLNPILGGGSESFAYQYRREFRDPTGRFVGRIDLPLHGTAHNVYAQTLAGKGVIGLLTLITLLAVLFIAPLRAVFSPSGQETNRRVAYLCAAASAAAFAIYGNVQEVFYIQPLQVIFFGILGSTAAILPRQPSPIQCRILQVVLALAVCGQLIWTYVWAKAPLPTLLGCYAEEVENGTPFHWCGTYVQLSPALSPLVLEGAPLPGGLRSHLIAIESDAVEAITPALTHGSRTSLVLHADTTLRAQTCYIPARDSPQAGTSDRRCLSFRIWK